MQPSKHVACKRLQLKLIYHRTLQDTKPNFDHITKINKLFEKLGQLNIYI